MTRKIIQITSISGSKTGYHSHWPALYAVCDDDTIWRLVDSALGNYDRKSANLEWEQLPSIPQEETL